MLIRLLIPIAVAAFGFHAPGVLAQPDAKELNEPTLYELLLGEIAQQRGDYALAAKTYLELARRTGDARIARRAVEVANQGKMPELALEAAKTWQEIEPQSPAALQVVAALLVSVRRVDEAEPYLEKLLSAEGVDPERHLLDREHALNQQRRYGDERDRQGHLDDHERVARAAAAAAAWAMARCAGASSG